MTILQTITVAPEEKCIKIITRSVNDLDIVKYNYRRYASLDST